MTQLSSYNSKCLQRNIWLKHKSQCLQIWTMLGKTANSDTCGLQANDSRNCTTQLFSYDYCNVNDKSIQQQAGIKHHPSDPQTARSIRTTAMGCYTRECQHFASCHSLLTSFVKARARGYQSASFDMWPPYVLGRPNLSEPFYTVLPATPILFRYVIRPYFKMWNFVVNQTAKLADRCQLLVM